MLMSHSSKSFVESLGGSGSAIDIWINLNQESGWYNGQHGLVSFTGCIVYHEIQSVIVSALFRVIGDGLGVVLGMLLYFCIVWLI